MIKLANGIIVLLLVVTLRAVVSIGCALTNGFGGNASNTGEGIPGGSK